MTAKYLYNQVVQVTTDYLGPAAERFIIRQIETHLNKAPEALTKKDVVKLADWIKVAVSLLTEDTHMVNNFTESILQIAEEKPSSRKKN